MAFVFDTTGSMGDDLVEAKYGASQILNTTLSLPNKPLHNYILVPFNDPGKKLHVFFLTGLSAR